MKSRSICVGAGVFLGLLAGILLMATLFFCAIPHGQCDALGWGDLVWGIPTVFSMLFFRIAAKIKKEEDGRSAK